MSKLTDMTRIYARAYKTLPYGREIEGTAELLLQLAEKLAEYEDLEEQGKLLKLPAAIGDEIFFIFMDCPKDYKEEYCRDHDGSCENCPHRVPEIVSRDFRMLDIPNMDRIFVTREEAEAALKELERGKGND